MNSSSVASALLWHLTWLVATECVPTSSLAITSRDRKMASGCLHVCESHALLCAPPFLMTSPHGSFPTLPTVLSCDSSSFWTPFVVPCRWVRAAAVRWPSCPQCLEPVGCSWWAWLCPQTTGWSWSRASSCNRTKAWRWRWHYIQASGEFASWLVGR